MNLKAGIQKLEQRIEKLQKNTCTISLEDALDAVIEKNRRRHRIRQSGDREAIKELEELEHKELLASLRELLQEADWIEDMEQHPDRETGNKIEDGLNAARIRMYSGNVTKALNKLLNENLPEDYDNHAAIKRLRDNQQAFMEKIPS